MSDPVETPNTVVVPPAVRNGEHVAGPTATERVVDSLHVVLTALMLAFMFRAFFVEAFIIPTGSMAPTLLGRHGTVVCESCGWEIDYGPEVGSGNHNGRFVAPSFVYCPNCHHRTPLTSRNVSVKGGDRILVHKWPFVIGGLLGPHRWDVIVFRDPANPEQNYIKRLIALPGETIEVVDGDVFVKPPGGDRFHIARKTPAAQSVLWFVVCDQDYLPTAVRDCEPGATWVVEDPVSNEKGGWKDLARRTIRYEGLDDRPRALRFDPTGSCANEYLQDVYAYNHGSGGNYVGDVRLRAEVRVTAGSGYLRWELERDGYEFAATFDRDGVVTLDMTPPAGEPLRIGSVAGYPRGDGRRHVLEFGHVDYRVYVRLDRQEILSTTDEQYAPDLETLRRTRRVSPPRLRMVAEGVSLEMRRLRIDRDVYYAYSRRSTQRAYANHPFRLADDEYFVMGDNSPNSYDGREWYRFGLHLRQALDSGDYQVGTVRADQIVGGAFFVYLPGLLPLDVNGHWCIPDLGRVRFIR